MLIARTQDLSPSTLMAIQRLLERTFQESFVEDWDHCGGGTHFVIELEGEPVGHASVVLREIHPGPLKLRTGYLEAVATHPDWQQKGLGSKLMRAVSDHIRHAFELGALSTGEHDFFSRFGWERWMGPTFVRTPEGLVRTQDEDGGVMVLRTHSTPEHLDLGSALSCDWRSGDVW